ncbi:MAG: phenylalanine--tRNA ligase subunit beta [Oscillospiraceae bacterium]|jgi:phenylalanyl-tRNA synthetase beta chain|nr:phenylalanine--tRNA ligase subunit beta [Oscillospiraceae bacterium]
MLISMNWVKEYVDLDGLNISELLKRFTLSTAEIDDIYYKGCDLKGVVVGKVISCEMHPNSQKLHLLKVDTSKRIYECVCGAPNVVKGINVAFAVDGALVGGIPISTSIIAGYKSEGMCCSEKELGISDNYNNIMLLDDSAELGMGIKELLPIDDIIFEVDNKSLTNRPDLWGHYGMAREFAVITGRELKELPQSEPDYSGSESVPVTILRSDLCYRYSCLRMDNVTRCLSPAEMRIRLYYCGMRSINFLADLTNYIMLEIGQPLHAFDSRKISNIIIRTPDADTLFVTLDGNSRTIDTNTLLICNELEPVAIAGIMGGLDSEIEGDTKGVVLEAACFDAVSIRKSSSRIGLRTDASQRYEKALDPEMTLVAIKRFVNLISKWDPTAVATSMVTDEYVYCYPEITIYFDKAYLDRYSGIDIRHDYILSTLTALGFQVSQSGDLFNVKVPSWRGTKDISNKSDLVEELTRIYGYDNFPLTSTYSLLEPSQDSEVRINDTLVKDILVLRHSMSEVHSYIWCDAKKYKNLGLDVEENVTIINGAVDNTVLRNSMIPHLLIAVYENRQYADSLKMFEIARVVLGVTQNRLCNERRILGGVLYSKNTSEEALYYQAISIINDLLFETKRLRPIYSKAIPIHNWQHPKNTSTIFCGDGALGTICALHPKNLDLLGKNIAVATFELDMRVLDELKGNAIQYHEASKYPSIDYDLTVRLEKGRTFNDVYRFIQEENLSDLTDVSINDIYKTEQGTNVTINLVFSSNLKTLVKDEVQIEIDRLIKKWEQNKIELC